MFKKFLGKIGPLKQILKASGVVFLGAVAVNLLNFLFTIMMGRLLGPHYFGEMVAIFSLLFFVGIPAGMFSNVITRFTAGYQALKKQWLLKKIFYSSARVALVTGILLTVIFWTIAPFVGTFLRVDALPLFFFGLVFPLFLLSAVATGTLQGLRRFLPFSATSIIATAIKLVFAVLLVSLGLSVSGVIAAFVLGILIGMLFAVSQTRAALGQNTSKKDKEPNSAAIRQEIISYAKTIFLSTLFLSLLSNLDMLLVKHYLFSVLAGQYAAMATVGKLVLYGTSPLLTVMFPLVSAKRSAAPGSERQVLKLFLGIILAISLAIVGVFALLPEFTIRMLFGKSYLPVAPYLVWYGLVTVLTTFSYSFINFFLAINKRAFLYPLAAITLLEGILIFLFHQDIFSIILALLTANGILLLSCVVLYLYLYHGK